jgi:eukaryotic-like serine/threonine-protein kinase
MSADQDWTQVQSLFEQALSQPPAERTAWARRNLGDQPAVLTQVLELLRAREEVGEFLEGPALNFIGQTFGHYRVTREIGRGGMSVVLEGERSDGDFTQRVAIKVILLQASGEMRQSETQILAALEHPNIARLLDAGTTPLGFRYIVMELVEGTPITSYCAELPESTRLKLFLDVCDAVQYAHRSLVVHRDIKPENILVNPSGQAKLLDFGIAKMLDPEAGAAQTQGIRAFSPNYASPEQLLGLPATTATDIFSLGVLLCEIQSGKTPRVLTGMNLEQIVDAARSRISEIPVGGDLGVIIRKALDPDPAQRYESVGAMARDINRYLSGMPIEAREPTWSYRAGKFIARHRWGVLAASLAVVSLIGALAFAIVQARMAETRFNQVRSLARSVMFELHDQVSDLPGSLKARKFIVDRSLEYLDALAADTTSSTAVQQDLAKGYLRLADIEGRDIAGSSLGRSTDASRHVARSLEIARRLIKTAPRDFDTRRILVDALEHSTTAHSLHSDFAKAIETGAEGVQIAESLVKDNPKDLDDAERLALISKQLADAYSRGAQREKALAYFERSLGMRQQIYNAEPTNPARQQRLAEANQWISSEYWWRKDYARAEEHARKALALDEQRYKIQPRKARGNVASDSLQMAMIGIQARRFEEALSYATRAYTLRKEMLDEDPNNAVAAMRTAAALNRMGIINREWGHFPDAVRQGRESLTIIRRLYQADPKNNSVSRELIYALSDLALTHEKAGQKPPACQLAREAINLKIAIPTSTQLKVPYEKMDKLAANCR